MENMIKEKKEKVKKTFLEIYKDFVKVLKRPELRVLPGQLAFYFLMSLIPIIALIGFLASYVIKNFDLYMLLENTLPTVLADTLYWLVNMEPSANIIFLIICYIWLASNGPSSIIITADTLYGIKVPGIVKLKVKSVVMTFFVLTLLLFIIFIPVLGDVIIEYVLKLVGYSQGLYKFVDIYNSLKHIATFIILFLNIKLLYTIAPDKTVKSKNTTVGALFTSISWLIITEIFAFYITNVAKFDLVYGNFANILILILWIYFLAYSFVVGLAINVNRYQND